MRSAAAQRPGLSYQALSGAAERLRRGNPSTEPEEEWLARVEEARDRLARVPFEPLPLAAFLLEKDGKKRQLVVARPADRIIEEALMPGLRLAIEPLLLPSVHGYRKGRSAFTAALEASRGLAHGLHHVTLLDIAGFFDAIDRSILGSLLTKALAPELARIVLALVAAPRVLKGHRFVTAVGIPQGLSISPILANLYLTGLDTAMADLNGLYLRYGDDLLVARATPEETLVAEQRIRTALASLSLSVREEKVRRVVYDGTPLVYLGHAVDAKGVFERAGGPRVERLTRGAPGASEAGSAARPESANERRQTLYLTEPGLYVAARNGLIEVSKARETLREIPLHRVDRVLVLAGVAMTSGFLSACVSRQIPVLFFVGRGKAYGSLVAGGLPNPLRLHSQYRLTGNAQRRMELGREIVTAKIEAMSRRLVNVPAAVTLRVKLAEIGSRVASAGDPPELRGLEGSATRFYYEGFAQRVKVPAFAFVRRSRRPPKDPINSLLSFAYSLLFGEMQTALLAHGLDPHPGVLHDLGRSHPALVSDLIEPYRPLIADSFVLTLVNNGRVSGESFEKKDDGFFLAHDARRAVLAEYEAFMARTSGGAKGMCTPRQLVDAAAKAMLRVVLGESSTLDLPLSGSNLAEVTAEEVAS